MSVDYAVNLWLDRGCPKEKLVMGMGTYGRTFTLVNKAKTGLNADASGPGAAGPSTSAKGFLSYYEICDFVKKSAKYNLTQVNNVEIPLSHFPLALGIMTLKKNVQKYCWNIPKKSREPGN